ncbi:uncharacterized protein BDV17DRAFT_252618, partial [Aspergillus undulatus]|uniref:uncharacterized protein n=1 Tax=Aspergillus undulatus TaxID=1810928 RepID=UPI003CCDE7DE
MAPKASVVGARTRFMTAVGLHTCSNPTLGLTTSSAHRRSLYVWKDAQILYSIWTSKRLLCGIIRVLEQHSV